MATKRTYPITIHLPDNFNKGIGAVVVAYAYLEWRLRNLVYEVANIGPKEGRVIRIARRAEDYPVLVKELLNAKGKDIDIGKQKGQKESLGKLLKRAEEARNLLAHGCWANVPEVDVPLVQVVEGSWQLKAGPKISSKIDPHGLIFSDDAFNTILRHIDVCISEVRSFKDRVRTILKEK